MLNRARPSGNSPGNNPTAWDSHAGLPPPQVSWFHTPAPPGRGVIRPSTPHPKTRSRAPLGWNNPPTPPPLECLRKPCNRSQMPSGHQQHKEKDTPRAELALNRLSENPGIFQQVESETIPLQAIPTTPPIPQKVPHKVSRAKRSGTFRSKTGSGEAPSAAFRPEEKPQHP